MLYGSEWWAVNKADIQRIDAVDQWCLWRILDIRWHDFVRNADVRRITNQPPLSSVIKSGRLTFFGHFAWVDENADASHLTRPFSNLLQRTEGDHQDGRAQLGWRTFLMICLRWILGYMRLEIRCKIGLSGDWCLCTALCTRSCACYACRPVAVLEIEGPLNGCVCVNNSCC